MTNISVRQSRPLPPFDFKGVASVRGINLSWGDDRVAGNSYRIFRQDTEGFDVDNPTELTTVRNSMQYIDREVVAGQTYYYWIESITEDGQVSVLVPTVDETTTVGLMVVADEVQEDDLSEGLTGDYYEYGENDPKTVGNQDRWIYDYVGSARFEVNGSLRKRYIITVSAKFNDYVSDETRDRAGARVSVSFEFSDGSSDSTSPIITYIYDHANGIINEVYQDTIIISGIDYLYPITHITPNISFGSSLNPSPSANNDWWQVSVQEQVI